MIGKKALKSVLITFENFHEILIASNTGSFIVTIVILSALLRYTIFWGPSFAEVGAEVGDDVLRSSYRHPTVTHFGKADQKENCVSS